MLCTNTNTYKSLFNFFCALLLHIRVHDRLSGGIKAKLSFSQKKCGLFLCWNSRCVRVYGLWQAIRKHQLSSSVHYNIFIFYSTVLLQQQPISHSTHTLHSSSRKSFPKSWQHPIRNKHTTKLKQITRFLSLPPSLPRCLHSLLIVEWDVFLCLLTQVNFIMTPNLISVVFDWLIYLLTKII